MLHCPWSSGYLGNVPISPTVAQVNGGLHRVLRLPQHGPNASCARSRGKVAYDARPCCAISHAVILVAARGCSVHSGHFGRLRGAPRASGQDAAAAPNNYAGTVGRLSIARSYYAQVHACSGLAKALRKEASLRARRLPRCYSSV